MPVRTMTISRFAASGGVGVETVRYYQRRGLLAKPSPRSTSYREYDETLLRRLRFIKRLQTAGFTLKEIQLLLKLDRTQDRLKIQEISTSKVAEIETQIRELKAVAAGLKKLIGHCRHAEHGAPCPIVEALEP